MLMVSPGRKRWEVNFGLPRILGTRFFSSHFLQIQISARLVAHFKAEIRVGEGEPSLCDGPWWAQAFGFSVRRTTEPC